MGKPMQAGSWDKVWRKGKPPWVYRNVVETVAREVKGSRAARVLEVGCGKGSTLLALAHAGARVVGLDYSPEAIAVCRKFQEKMENAANSTFLLGDARRLPFADESFDFVYSIGVIEHFAAPGALLAEQRRVLRAGGTLLVQVPQKYSLGTLAKKILIPLGKWPYGGWETQFSAAEISELAVKAGFEPQLCYGYGSFTLAMVRHFLAPRLGFGGMWQMGLNTPWIRTVKARTAMDVCLVARKNGMPKGLQANEPKSCFAAVSSEGAFPAP